MNNYYKIMNSIVFAIVFPAYFSYMASSSDAMGGAAAGAKGKWQVNFIQDNLTSDETMNLADGEQGDFFFDLDSGDMMIGYVENCTAGTFSGWSISAR